MSAQTWKDEYYPVPADSSTLDDADEITLVKHALQKWEGLLPENLEKHKVALKKKYCVPQVTQLEDTAPDTLRRIGINSDTCSLCAKYLTGGEIGEECTICPLYQFLGKHCDGGYMPYYHFYNTLDPVPMVHALRQCLEIAEKKKDETKPTTAQE